MLEKEFNIPFQNSLVAAGFPSPADDFLEEPINLNRLLIKHPSSTFFLRVSGDSMVGAGIFDKDLLIVDRSLAPLSGKIIIAAIDGELTVKRLIIKNKQIFLSPENPSYDEIIIQDPSSLHVWGVVTTVIHSL